MTPQMKSFVVLPLCFGSFVLLHDEAPLDQIWMHFSVSCSCRPPNSFCCYHHLHRIPESAMQAEAMTLPPPCLTCVSFRLFLPKSGLHLVVRPLLSKFKREFKQESSTRVLLGRPVPQPVFGTLVVSKLLYRLCVMFVLFSQRWASGLYVGLSFSTVNAVSTGEARGSHSELLHI